MDGVPLEKPEEAPIDPTVEETPAKRPKKTPVENLLHHETEHRRLRQKLAELDNPTTPADKRRRRQLTLTLKRVERRIISTEKVIQTTPSTSMSGNLWKYNDVDSSSQFYCELCEYKAATKLGYEAHIHGFKHKKKVELTANQPYRSVRVTQNKDFHCKLCEVYCSSREMLNTHLRGQKHLKKMANSDNSVGFYQYGGTAHTKLKASVLEGKLIDFDKAIVGLDFIVEIHPTDNKKEPRFLCELCDAKSDIRVIVSHLVGQKHRQNYLKHTRWDDYDVIIKGKNNSKMKADELECFMATIEVEDGRGRVVIKEEFDDKLHTTDPQEGGLGLASGWDQQDAEIDDKRKPDYDHRYEDDRKEDSYKYDRDHRRRDSRSPHRRSSRSPHRRTRSPRSRHSRSPDDDRWVHSLDEFKLKMESVSRRNERPSTWKNVLEDFFKKIDTYDVQSEEEASLTLSISNTLTQKLMAYRLSKIPGAVRNLIDSNPQQDVTESSTYHWNSNAY